MSNRCGSKPPVCLRQFYKFLHIASICLSLTEFGLNSGRRITRLSSPHGPAATSTSWATRVQDILFLLLLIHSYIHVSMHSFIHIYVTPSIHPSSHSDIFSCVICAYIHVLTDGLIDCSLACLLGCMFSLWFGCAGVCSTVSAIDRLGAWPLCSGVFAHTALGASRLLLASLALVAELAGCGALALSGARPVWRSAALLLRRSAAHLSMTHPSVSD